MRMRSTGSCRATTLYSRSAMLRNVSRAFRATALPAGVLALAVTGWASWTHATELAAVRGELALIVVFALLSHAFSFSTALTTRVSLELAYLIAAALALPYPSAMLAGGVAALGGSLLRVERPRGTSPFAAIVGANIAVATMMTAAASALRARLGTPFTTPEFPPEIGMVLLLSTALFAAMSAVNLAAMAAWVALRGGSPRSWARNFLGRILPGEAVTIPFGCLLAVALADRSGELTLVLLGTIGLFVSFALKTLSDSRERLRSTNRDLEDRVAELATLNAIGREISSSLDPVRVFQIVRRECRKVLALDFFWIARVVHETHEIHVEYSMAGEVPSHTTSFPLGQGLTSHVVRSEKPLLVQDASNDPRMKSLRPIVIEPTIRSILAVPLLIENRVVGVISVQC